MALPPYTLREALTKCKYPKWALDKIERRFSSNNQEENKEGSNQSGQSGSNNDNNSRDPEGRGTTKDKYTKGHIVIPYTQWLGESIKNICKRYRIQTHIRGNTTINCILVKPKGKDPLDKKSGAIYWYLCGELMCDDEYIGESSGTFGERYKEHFK